MTQAHSISDLAIGQVVMYVDEKTPQNSGRYRVAFVDEPEAILKPVEGNGWPRISFVEANFRLNYIHLFILEQAPPGVLAIKNARAEASLEFMKTYAASMNGAPPCDQLERAVIDFVNGIENV